MREVERMKDTIDRQKAIDAVAFGITYARFTARYSEKRGRNG